MNERQHRSTWLHTESSFVRTHPHRPFIQKMVGCRLNAVLFKLHRTGSVGRRLPTSKPFQESGKRRCKCLLSPRVLCCMVCQRDVVLQSTPCSCKLCVCVCVPNRPRFFTRKPTRPPRESQSGLSTRFGVDECGLLAAMLRVQPAAFCRVLVCVWKGAGTIYRDRQGRGSCARLLQQWIILRKVSAQALSVCVGFWDYRSYRNQEPMS